MASVVHERCDSKVFDLEDRTFLFARDVRTFLHKIPKLVLITDDCSQLQRSSGSVGANYIEAHESLSRKDFVMRIKICLKEAKESTYWLSLIENFVDPGLQEERKYLVQESYELQRIFGSILRKIRTSNSKSAKDT